MDANHLRRRHGKRRHRAHGHFARRGLSGPNRACGLRFDVSAKDRECDRAITLFLNLEALTFGNIHCKPLCAKRSDSEAHNRPQNAAFEAIIANLSQYKLNLYCFPIRHDDCLFGSQIGQKWPKNRGEIRRNTLPRMEIPR